MSLSKRVYLLQTAFLTALLAVIGGIGYYFLLPDYYFASYPLIPVFFFVLGLLMINVFDKYNKEQAFATSKSLRGYLLMRMIRMFASIVIVIVYCLSVREGIACFLTAFIVNYLIYLVFDSWFFAHWEKRTLEREKKNETIV